MTINQRVRAKREELKLSQAELARRVGVTTQAVQHWESTGPDRTSPGRAKRAKLAKTLGVSENWLEFGDQARQRTGAAEPTTAYDLPSDEALQVAVAYDRLSAAEKAYYRAAIFRDAALGSVMPWFRTGKPANQSYDRYERSMERDFEQRMRQLNLKLEG